MSFESKGNLPSDFEFAALTEARNYRAALIRRFSPYLEGNVIEVGAGAGQITEELKGLARLKRLLSIEPDPRLCQAFRSRLPQNELLKGTAVNAPRDTNWNGILSVNVLEHIEDDQSELAHYRKLLQKEHGHLCLFVPARPEIYAPIDKDFGHYRRYVPNELRVKLQTAGFEIVYLHYFNLVGYFAWWLTFRVVGKRHFDRGSVRLFDRWIFPAVHWFESNVCVPPLGQSLIAVARA